MVRHSIRSSNWPLSVPCVVWPSLRDGLFDSWMWKMHFCRVFLLRWSTWNNLQGSLIPLIPIMYASLPQYLWPQTGSTGLVFSPQKLSSHNGFCGLQSDTSLFLRWVGTDFLLVLIYVDDIITGNDSRALNPLVQELGREFSLKDLSPLHYFLGVECHRTPWGLFLSQ